MLGWYATGRENIDGDKFVIDSFFLEREAHGSHVDAIGCPEHDRLFGGCHHESPLIHYSILTRPKC
jgi:hypothetical protein